jgi:hypothetical protein
MRLPASAARAAILFLPILSPGFLESPARAKAISANVTMTLQPPAIAGASVGPTTLSGTATLLTGKGRIEITKASGPSIDFQQGDYLLLLDSVRTAYLRPASQQFWNVDSPFLNPLAQLTGNAGQIAMSGVNVTMEKLGAGDSLGGYATQRYKINAEYTVTAGATRIPSGMVIELTVARTPVQLATPALAGVQSFGISSSGEVTSRVNAFLKQVAADGLIIKSVSTTWFSVATLSLELIQTTELTDLKEVDAEESAMVMPTGFRPGT